MATVTYRGPDGKVMTGQTGNGSLPPQVESLYTSKYQQPQAQLQETQASTGAAGASAAAAEASAQKSQIDLNQNAALSAIQKYFDSQSGSDQKVSPQTYNDAKKKAEGLGIPGDKFDNSFEQSYTNPTNTAYDTTTDINYRQKKQQVAQSIAPAIQNLIKNYDGLSVKGPEAALLTGNPIGQYLAKKLHKGEDSIAYDQSVNAFAPALKDITAGATTTGLRLNWAEIQNMSNLIPQVGDSKGIANYKIKQLNDALVNNFGKDYAIDKNILDKYSGSSKAHSSQNQQSSSKFSVGNYQVEVGQ